MYKGVPGGGGGPEGEKREKRKVSVYLNGRNHWKEASYGRSEEVSEIKQGDQREGGKDPKKKDNAGCRGCTGAPDMGNTCSMQVEEMRTFKRNRDREGLQRETRKPCKT